MGAHTRGQAERPFGMRLCYSATPPRKLIAAVELAARTAGASRLYWLTHETNETAQMLYNKVADRPGFVQYRKKL